MNELKQIEKLVDVGKYDSAKQQLEGFLKNNPRDDEAWLLMGHIHYYTGDNKSSMECYRSALQINPKNRFAKEQLAEAEWSVQKEQADKLQNKRNEEGYVFEYNLHPVRLIAGFIMVMIVPVLVLIFDPKQFVSEPGPLIALFIVILGCWILDLRQLLFSAIKFIVNDDKIKFKTLFYEKEYKWSQVKEAIKKTRLNSRNDVYTYLTINTIDGKRYCWLLDSTFHGPSFKGYRLLLEQINKHVPIKQEHIKKNYWLDGGN